MQLVEPVGWLVLPAVAGQVIIKCFTPRFVFFSDISERKNDYSDTLDFRRGRVGEVGMVTFFILEVPDYESAMLIYFVGSSTETVVFQVYEILKIDHEFLQFFDWDQKI